MNILTFDIEDWYNCDFISNDFNWDKYEVRIYKSVNVILEELNKRNIKGTFFTLGWIAEKHPDVLRIISEGGHHIGCHSYQHELSFRFDMKEFRNDTLKAKEKIEDVIGKEVNAFRAPGFSITQKNKWALSILHDIGFIYDCSIFPAYHDYGGMPSYGKSIPQLIELGEGRIIKEFPINIHSFLGKNIVFSGGGFFRLFPYWLIRRWGKEAKYVMTYFHPRDFDYGHPVIKSLPLMRRFKSYVGIKGAFIKFQKMLDDFEFINLEQADELMNWKQTPILTLDNL
jgi:polysaccharide deacetylase family protein (PEP-CTERM system associated)